MASYCESNDFNQMTVTQIGSFLIQRGVSVNGYNKPALVEIAFAVQKMGLPCIQEMHTSTSGVQNEEQLFINEMQIGDPFKMDKFVNNFIDSPPFGLYDIFNYLIYHSTAYDKQGLAAYKSFEDYRLFEDGYVESLLTKTLANARLHVYVGKVRPAMKTKTDEGKECYDLWFIVEGKGANRGSTLKAKCMCKGGRDGGCKHLGAAMYSLEELLNMRGDTSATSGPCLWMKKAQSSTKPCDMAELVIEKFKLPSHKMKKQEHSYSQYIDVDVRATNDRNQPSKKKLMKLTRKMKELKPARVSLPLLRKLYLPKPKPGSSTGTVKTKVCEDIAVKSVGIMERKLTACIKGNPEHNSAQIYKTLFFTAEEIKEVNDATVKQWQCKEWYTQKAGFITASKSKQVFTRQTTIEKNKLKGKSTDATCLVSIITHPKVPPNLNPIHHEPQHSREWGLVHEESARKAYYTVERHNHHKLQLLPKGFLISSKKKFLGASPDNIRRCHCSTGCSDVIVEYKCPWKHQDLHPKEAFVTPEIGGVMANSVFTLSTNSPYYFQLQTLLYVAELTLCDLVIWTRQGIYTHQVQFDAVFVEEMCQKLEAFWLNNVLPVAMQSVSQDTASPHGM